MFAVSAPPAGSAITVQRAPDHSALSWHSPKGSILRYGIGLFMICWLGGWAWALVTVGGQLLGAESKEPRLFLVFWLGAWIIGGGMAMVMLTRLFRPARDERLLVYHDRLVHDPGSVPFDPFLWGGADRWRLWVEAFKRRRRTEIMRQGAREPKLERVGERLRLSIDHGAERTEIGEFLREPEKEWLLGVLREWRAA